MDLSMPSPSCSPGFKSQAQYLCFLNYIDEIDAKFVMGLYRTKINRKEAMIVPYFS